MYFSHTNPAMVLSSTSVSVGWNFDLCCSSVTRIQHLLLIYNPLLTICEQTLNVKAMNNWYFVLSWCRSHECNELPFFFQLINFPCLSFPAILVLLSFPQALRYNTFRRVVWISTVICSHLLNKIEICIFLRLNMNFSTVRRLWVLLGSGGIMSKVSNFCP